MRATLAATAVTAAALLLYPVSADAAASGHAPTSATFYYGNEGLRICTSGSPEQGSAQFAVEGMTQTVLANAPDYVLTPVLNSTGDALANDPVHTCYDIDLSPGLYRITPGKYMSARCLRTANGTIVQRPTPTNPTGLEFSDARCRAFVHHFHTKHDGGNTSTLEEPEIEVTVVHHEVTEVDAHVVPEGYPECTVSGDPAGNPNRRCEPTGPTG